MMRKRIPAYALVLFAICASLAKAQTDPAISVEIEDKDDREWLECMNLPTTAALHAKAVEISAARAEINDLKKVARTIFIPAAGLSETAIERNAIPVPALHDANDILVVEQNTPAGLVVVQDGKAVNVLVDPAGSKRVSIEDKSSLEKHVMQVARSVFDLPAPQDQNDKFTVHTAKTDLGKSKTGSICYGEASSPNWIWNHWYSVILWWSDGDRVLYKIDKYGILHPEVDRSKMASQPKEMKAPRKFGHPR